MCSFLVGVIVTVSEPDLQVLAHQVPGVPDLTLILSVAMGPKQKRSLPSRRHPTLFLC